MQEMSEGRRELIIVKRGVCTLEASVRCGQFVDEIDIEGAPNDENRRCF